MNKKLLADFFRHFSQLLASGEQLIDALKKCRKHSYMKDDTNFVDYLIKTVSDGNNLGPALLDIGFPRDYIGYLNRGEWEGRLDQMTEELSKALEADAMTDPELELTIAGAEKLKIDARSDEAISIVDKWLKECAALCASDLHVIPVKGWGAVIKYRVNGTLREITNIDRDTLLKVTARIKFMACLDLAEKRLPQDGRMLIKVAGKELDLRVSTVPVFLGEKITVRFVNKTETIIGLDKLCFTREELGSIKKMIARPYGLILVTGRSGSGKTTTCYSMLYDYIENGANVVTIERPFEMLINGATQIALEPSIGLDYAAAIRTALRTDPDVIFVGEFQDREVVDLALKAAQTGHVVIGQFHSGTVVELIDMLVKMDGVEPSMLANILNGVISQALLRKLCDCKKKVKTVPAAAKKQGCSSIFQSAGCEKCLNSGYKGRTPVYEVVTFDRDMKEAIAAKNMAEFKKLINTSLEKRAMELVKTGVTSLEELQRVFGII